MKRRFTAAAVLIGILLIGVFTTVITSNFVSSQAEKIATDSVVSEGAAGTPENIVLSRNEAAAGITSSRPQIHVEETEEEETVSDTDEENGTETEFEDAAPVEESGSAAAETETQETESAVPASAVEDNGDTPASEDNVISPLTPNGPSVTGDIYYESSYEASDDEAVISEIGSSGPGDYVSISPLDTAAADSENNGNSVSDPGNGNVTSVGESTEAAETVKSPLEGAEPQSEGSSSVTNTELLARLVSVEEKTAQNSSESVSPQAAEYELNLWNYEMNYIADTLRSAMDYDSAESLLQEQLKFLKERDTAYDSGAMASRAQAESDTSYITEATEKTRQRCYYLLDTYGDILD